MLDYEESLISVFGGENNFIDVDFLKTCEERDNIFPNMDYKIYG